MRRFFAFVGIGLVNCFVPKKRSLLLHAFPDVEDQMIAVLRWLEANPVQRLPVVCLTSGPEADARQKLALLVGGFAEEITVLRKTTAAAVWAYWRSRYVLFSHGLYGFQSVPARQCVVNLWHGMPIKRIWKGLPGSRAPSCTWLLSTSHKYSEVLAAASGFSTKKILVTGLPRNDLLFSRTKAARQFGQRMRDGVKRVLLFLPTYRQSRAGFVTSDGRETANTLAMAEAEIVELRQMLADTGIRILVKPHPMSVHYGRNEEIDERLWIISDEWLHQQRVTLYEALGQMDAIITDVSSVYVDFLSLRRPVFFYFPDFEEYRRARTFLLEPVEQWLAGPLCRTGQGINRCVMSLRRRPR